MKLETLCLKNWFENLTFRIYEKLSYPNDYIKE